MQQDPPSPSTPSSDHSEKQPDNGTAGRETPESPPTDDSPPEVSRADAPRADAPPIDEPPADVPPIDEPRPAAARPEALGPEGPPPAGGHGGDRSGPGSGSRWEEPRPSGSRWEQPEVGGARDDEGPRGAYRDSGTGDPHNARRARIEQNLKSKSTWLRLVFIVLFAIALSITELLLTVVIAVQFVWVLINGEPNDGLQRLGQSLARYVYQIIRYLTFNSDVRPFPVDLDWPSDRVDPSAD